MLRFTINIIDSHVHFIDPSRPEGIDWPAPDSALYRKILPTDFISTFHPTQGSGCIAVETSRRSMDDAWLLQLAQANKLIRGVVLNLQPDLPDFARRLDEAAKFDKFAGIRLRPIEHYDLSSSQLIESFSLLEAKGKTIEFGAKTFALKKSFARLALHHPGISWILDHGGHPPENGILDLDWQSGIKEIAALPNVVAKTSGAGNSVADCQPALDSLMEFFGPDRLLYGSNWPVSAADGDLTDRINLLTEYFNTNAGQFFSGNAQRVYKLKCQNVESHSQ